MKKQQTLPLMLTATITGTAILIAMSGVAFLSYGLYAGLLAAFAIGHWAAALATAGGAFVSAILFVGIATRLLSWRHGLHHKVREYKRPGTYADRIETEIDARLEPEVSNLIGHNPKAAVLVGLALGVAAGSSRGVRRFLMELGRDLDLIR